MKAHGEVEIQLHSFINFDTGWRPVVKLTHRMLYPGIHSVGSWAGPRAGPNVLKKRNKNSCPHRDSD
jgi:hypothetical protein